jgi:hypothetical protein
MLWKQVTQTEWHEACLRSVRGQLELAAGKREFASPALVFPNGEENASATLAKLAVQARKTGVVLRGCANCVRFRFSGLSFQFSGGWTGYCSLVGVRKPDGEVSIDFGCGEHSAVPGWPDDLDVAQNARLALAAKERKPSRQNVFRGAMLGVALSRQLALAMPVVDSLAAGETVRALHNAESLLAAVPVGLFWWRDATRGVEVARGWGEAAAAAALVVALAMNKRAPLQMIDALLKPGSFRLPGIEAQLQRLRQDLAADPGTQRAGSPLGLVHSDEEALVGALHAFGYSPLDFEQSMLSARTHGGNGPAAGLSAALSGAFNGAESFPPPKPEEAGQAALALAQADRLHAAAP